MSPLTDDCREWAISSFTVGFRLSSGSALCAKITDRAGSIPVAR